MHDKPVALITGANQDTGLQIAKNLVTHGFTVLIGSRNLERGEAAAGVINGDARVIQLDVTDQASITAAAGTNLNGCEGTETLEEGAAEALLGPAGPTGTLTHAKLGTLPW